MDTTQSDHNHVTRRSISMAAAVLILLSVAPSVTAGPDGDVLPLQVSTVPAPPANGDLNPYGLAVVPNHFPGSALHEGQLLVSNFNDGSNSSGMGSTIIFVDPTNGKTGLFFQGSPPIGFTNALAVAKAGFVFAGSVFTNDGVTGMAGALLVLDKDGAQVPIQPQLGVPPGSQKINGPWGMAINDRGKTAQLFVSNVFDGTITRLEVSLQPGAFGVIGTPLTIASGYQVGTDQTAIVVGPAGLAYDSKNDILYVAAEKDNAIFALAGAGTTTTDLGKGTLVFADSALLHGPLGLILTPSGHLITANADPPSVPSTAGPSEIVEFTKAGEFVRTFSIDSAFGSAFAINLVSKGAGTQFSYVDDAQATLSILRLSPK
jgi:hypothetical protein